MRKRNEKGFSLLELLIVVAIILIIATIAIPSLLRSRQSTNESAAIGDLRSVNTGEVTYASSNAQNYATLVQLSASGLIDSRFNGGVGTILHGQNYTADGAVITDAAAGVVGGAQTAMYGITTAIDGTSARYDYETGVDAVVRYRANFPAVGGFAAESPVK